MTASHPRSSLLTAFALAVAVFLTACVPAGGTEQSDEGLYLSPDTARGVMCYSKANRTGLSCVRVRPETVFVRVVGESPEASVVAPKPQ
jgi:hypothetical protein